MVKVNSMRWSGRSQDLLVRAIADPAFIVAMRKHGLPESQMRLWLSLIDVPITYRAQLRGWLEDCAHGHPDCTMGARMRLRPSCDTRGV